MMLPISLTVLCVFAHCVQAWNSEIRNSSNLNCSFLVLPNNVTCPNNTQIQCSNFSTYIQNPSFYFQSQTTFCFLPGEHFVGTATNLTIVNISNLALIGLGALETISVENNVREYGLKSYDEDENIEYYQSTCIIKCDKGFSFGLTGIVNLSLINITLKNCGAPSTMLGSLVNESLALWTIPTLSVAVVLINVSNLYMQGVSIQNSTGYGLLGINVLGHSSLSDSSFVGNNQIARNSLQLYNHIISLCLTVTYYSSPFIYVNSAADDYYAGGNAAFVYLEAPNSSVAESILTISSCLFALGIDGSFSASLATKYVSWGTGLGLIALQAAYPVRAFIFDSTMYRNQASYGANLHVQVTSANSQVTLSGIISAMGNSVLGGSLYYSVNPFPVPPESARQNSFQVINSTFSVDFNYLISVYVDASNQVVLASVIRIQGCIFYANVIIISTLINGTAIASVPVRITNCTFTTSQCDGGIGAYYADITLTDTVFRGTNVFAFESHVLVLDSKFSDNEFTSPFELYYSHLSLTGSVLFVNNTSFDGGALYLFLTDVALLAPANVTFTNNRALYQGGAIYTYENPPENFISNLPCRFLFSDPNGTLESPGIHLHFDNNSAFVAGDVLYGGSIESCLANCTLVPKYGPNCSLLALGSAVTTLGPNQNRKNLISSDAIMVCGCTEEMVDCNKRSVNIATYPGQTIQIPIATVGQLETISPDAITNYSCDINGTFSLGTIRNCTNPSYFGEQHTSSARCVKFNHTVVGKNGEETQSVLFLFPETAYITDYYVPAYNAFISIRPCPYGFQFNQTTRACTCDNLLLKYGIGCDINDGTIKRTSTVWIGNYTNGILAVHSHCPNSYCLSNDAWIKAIEQSGQCDYNRTGILCGQCGPNASVMFGSVACSRECSDLYLLLVIPIAVAGLLFVMSLFLFNCTIREGTLNGLILYTNVVRPSVIDLLTTAGRNRWPEKFFLMTIDWLNLDLGFEICFYEGMDTYAKTWLQLLFPAYIFILVGAVIIGSRWSTRLAHACRRNAVPVLGTLIQLSYTKLLSTIITIFSSTTLDVGYTAAYRSPRVWLADGNVAYAQGRHIALLAVGCVVTALFICPYTAMLLLSPWLLTKSHWKTLHWINKLKPFLDAHQAPFKDKFRYWPGVFLLIRVILYVVFTTNDRNDIDINLLATVLVLSLYCCVASTLSVYKNWYLIVLDNFFLINIIFLASSVLYLHRSDAEVSFVLVTISTASSLIVIVAILLFHVVMKVKITRSLQKIVGMFKPMKNIVQYDTETQQLRYGTCNGREILMEDS